MFYVAIQNGSITHTQGNVLGLSTFIRYSRSDCTINTYFNGYLFLFLSCLLLYYNYEIVIVCNHIHNHCKWVGCSV